MLEFLPQHVKRSLQHVNLQYVYELRIRANQPITLSVQGTYRYLGEYGLTDVKENAIQCDLNDIADCVYRAGDYSVYSVEEQIKRGFITAANGERIGLAGRYVLEKGQPLTIREFTSLCIRIPHEIVGCGQDIYQRCMRDKLLNLLIVSPPGMGKTTILRDLGRILSQNTKKNVLICDERGEISSGFFGETCDVLLYANKATAFDAGIRAMRPDIMITDELSPEDVKAVQLAIFAGITVLASAHFSDMSSIKPPFFGTFDRYVVLDSGTIGKIKEIYDESGRVLN